MTPLEKFKKLAKSLELLSHNELMRTEHIQSGYDAVLPSCRSAWKSKHKTNHIKCNVLAPATVAVIVAEVMRLPFKCEITIRNDHKGGKL